MWFIGVEVGQETSAPPPKKNPGSAPVSRSDGHLIHCSCILFRSKSFFQKLVDDNNHLKSILR